MKALRKSTKSVNYEQIQISPLYYLGQSVSSLLRMLFLLAICFVILYPLLYMISTAIRSYQDFYDVTVVWIPKTFTLENITFVLSKMKLGRSLITTVGISVLCTVAEMMVCSLTAYGFARFHFRGSKLLFALVLLTIMIPPQMMNIPNYLLMKNFDIFGLFHLITGQISQIKLLDTVWCFVLPAALGQGIRAGLFILIFRQLYTGLSTELEEAALIDGCGYFRTYLHIMMPNAKNAFAICGLFSLVWYWSDYYQASIFTVNMKTMALELAAFRTTVTNYLPMADQTAYHIVPLEQAACLLFILPLILVFLLFQRTLSQSIDKTGLVG